MIAGNPWVALSTRRLIPTRDLTVQTISLEDLIRVKEHIRRPKDRDSLFQLQAIKQIRAESQKK